MSKVILQGHIVVPNTDLEAVSEALPKHIELTQQEPGCLIFKVFQDTDNESIFHVYEEFDSQDSFKKHQQRVRNSSWGALTVNVERHYAISE